MGRPGVILTMLVAAAAAAAWAVLASAPAPAPGVVATRAPSGNRAAAMAAAEPQATTRAAVAPPAGDALDATEPLHVLVHVVRQGSGAPVPLATVGYLPYAVDWERVEEEQGTLAVEQWQAWWPDGDERLRRLGGVETRADAQGFAALSVRAAATLVVARAEGLYGQAELDLTRAPGDGSYRVTVAPDLTLTLQTVHPDGRPAPGIEVVLVPAEQHADEDPRRIGPRRTSAEDGTLTVPHLAAQLGSWGQGGPTRLLVSPYIAGVPLAGPEVELQALPADPVLVPVPATGSLRVRVLDRMGGPLAPALVSVRADPSVAGCAGQPRILGEGHELLLPHVALQQRFEVDVLAGQLRELVLADGPRRPGEEVVVDVVVGEARLVLVGRLVDGRGRALAAQPIRLRGTDFPDRRQRTDALGRFRIVVQPRLRHAPTAPALDVLGLPEPGSTAPLPPLADLPDGVHDLGDVVAEPPPRIVSGTLTGDRAAVLQEVWLWLEREDPGPVVDAGARWRRVDWPLAFRSGGAFAFFGAVEPGRWRLAVSSDAHVPVEPIELELGREGLVIPLTRGGAARALVLADAGFEPWHLQASLTLTDPPPPRPGSRQGQLEEDADPATFVWHGLVPGRYRLAVGTAAPERVLATVDGIDVPADGPAADPRLTVDLRGRLQRVVLTVCDPAGRPLTGRRGGVVLVAPEGGAAELRGQDLGLSGQVHLTLADRAADLIVAVPGFRVQEVRGVHQSTTVTLTPAPRVSLTLAPGSVQPSAQAPIWLSVTPLDAGPARAFATPGRGGRLSGFGLELEPRMLPGAAAWRLQTPGRYRIEAVRRSPTGATRLCVEPVEIEVQDRTEPQSFAVLVTEERR